jgi:hypothetical protein
MVVGLAKMATCAYNARPATALADRGGTRRPQTVDEMTVALVTLLVDRGHQNFKMQKIKALPKRSWGIRTKKNNGYVSLLFSLLKTVNIQK